MDTTQAIINLYSLIVNTLSVLLSACFGWFIYSLVKSSRRITTISLCAVIFTVIALMIAVILTLIKPQILYFVCGIIPFIGIYIFQIASGGFKKFIDYFFCQILGKEIPGEKEKE